MDARAASGRLILNYYTAFNRGDCDAMLNDEVAHDINQGSRQTGWPVFAAHPGTDAPLLTRTARRNHCMIDRTGRHAAAEYRLRGEYLATDAGLPKANGQPYVLLGGAFFALRNGRIARISNDYNLGDWLRQIDRPDR